MSDDAVDEALEDLEAPEADVAEQARGVGSGDDEDYR
jgi:hypothetical protein